MHVISRKSLREFAARHPPAKGPLDAWFAEASRADWGSFADVKAAYGSADLVAGNRVIFNIGGNKYRLIDSLQLLNEKADRVWPGMLPEFFLCLSGTSGAYADLPQ